jgi:hypothetical protein
MIDKNIILFRDLGAAFYPRFSDAQKVRLAAFCGAYSMPRSEHLIPFRT